MAEFEGMVKSMNKKGEFKSDILQDVSEKIEEVPGVDKPQLQQEISVSGETSAIANLQSQIDSLDARVTALENP